MMGDPTKQPKVTGIPKFDGSNVRHWLRLLNAKFDLFGRPVPDALKIQLAGETVKEKTKAESWFIALLDSQDQNDGIKTWEEFKEAAMTNFLTPNEWATAM